ncbi:hypothetical protein F5X99DRAFT_410251 [Biscogniauxia marginata]|nr:hypothetical protein F5X99DRAFT_410251 [Biscogniauxia marginata]
MSSTQNPADPQTSRVLFKGKLRAPVKPPSPRSYTLGPAPITEITVRTRADKRTTQDPMPISSTAVAQPFVDPAVLERRKHPA